jgi:hypothetical protein
MNDIANKMRETVDAEMNTEEAPEENIENTEVNENTEVAEPSEIESIAADSGWSPDKKDKDGNSLTAEEYMARKPLFNKIRNQGDQLTEIRDTLRELKADNLKIAKEGAKEKEALLAQLEEAREESLTNLDVDDVRKIDKQIKEVSKEIADIPAQPDVSPYFEDFTKDNEWAKDENHPLTLAAEGIARRYVKENGENIDDKAMYKHIHDQVRKDFPEKFDVKPRQANKVASAKNRSTTNYDSKKGMTLSDITDEETRGIVKNMARQTGKTPEEYLKNYTPDDFK